ncbi:MAG: Hsp20/alpha crystallin family protein [Candidatus Peribacteraceae bacterium]|nr:Hsp20/alpha crystallin family protein [Candidatus Peribacteraceae bacterium]
MGPSPFHGIFSAFDQDDVSTVHDETSAIGLPPMQMETPVPTSPHSSAQKGHIAVDIFEQDNYYIIRAPIAGVKLSDLDIEVDDKVLTIRGIRRMTDEVPKDQYYLQECFWGEFSRSIRLPIVIDPKKVKATFSKDSVLKVLIPKEEKVKIVRINEG